MARLTGWRLDLKKRYGLPMMFATRLFRDYDNKKGALQFLSETRGDLCFSCLDYKNSDELERLRVEYKGDCYGW